jgi:hypothetical protein
MSGWQRSFAMLVLALSACVTGDDDEDEGCDLGLVDLQVDQPDTAALDFGDGVTYPVSWLQTAVDGSEQFRAVVANGCGAPVAAAPLTVAVTDPSILTAEVDAGGILVHAHAEGTTNVQIRSGTQYVWDGSLGARPVASVHLAARELGVPDAFLAGTPLAAVGLFDNVGAPLWDGGISVIGAPRGASPDELAIGDLAAGDHPLEILAAGATWPVTLRIVDTIDEVVARDASLTISTDTYVDVCFFARRAGQLVAGAPWKFSQPGHMGDVQNQANCITVGGAPPGDSYTVTAEALGHRAATVVTTTR